MMNTHPFGVARESHRPWSEMHPLAFEADWKQMLLVHLTIAPERLAPHVHLPLDLYDGKAYLSLVSFSFERFRLAGSGTLGRWLARPFSDHPFLNLRTYVRGPAGPGIFFIAEWITNRLSFHLGPLTHGLPYRLGNFCVEENRPGGTSSLRVEDERDGHGELRITYPSRRDAPQVAKEGSRDAFLLERYLAYTSRGGVTRAFTVRHTPWRFERPDWIRAETALLSHTFPWFAGAEIIGAHTSEGFENVYMGPPAIVFDPRCISLARAPTHLAALPPPCSEIVSAYPDYATNHHD